MADPNPNPHSNFFQYQVSKDLNLLIRQYGKAYLNDVFPPAPDGFTNVIWQTDSKGNISAYAEPGGGGGTPIYATTFTNGSNATGQIWMVHSRPLENEVGGAILWNSFALDGSVPLDAVIQGIYPVVVASGNHDQANLRLGYGTGIANAPFDTPFLSDAILTSFSSTEFYKSLSIGTDLSILTTQGISADIDQSTSINNMTDHLQITACGFAIYYTSANPIINAVIPPPFSVPSGQGVAWALPTVATTNAPGQVIAITSSQLASNVTTYGFEPIIGPTLTVGQILTIAGTTNDGGNLNPAFATITGISGNLFTVSGPSGSASFQLENGVGVIGDAPNTGAAGASPAVPATAVIGSPISGTVPGSNFNLPSIPDSGSLILNLDGTILDPNTQYTQSGTAVTLVTPLEIGHILSANYFINSGGGGGGGGVTFVISALAPTSDGNFQVSHTLGKVPIGVIIEMTGSGQIWFQSPTLFDANNIYLVASDVGLTGFALAFG